MAGLAVLLVPTAASAQIPPPGFAVDRHVLAELGTSWIAYEATWYRGQSRDALGVGDGLSYRELVRHANDGMPTNTLRDRFLAPLVASLRSWARAGSVDQTGKSPVPPAVAATSSRESPPQPGAKEVVGAAYASLDRVVMEIKGRLPYFQACANASRRRGGQDLHRLLIVWSIAPDGSIKDLKVEGVSDGELATCIHRVGRRPIPLQPGSELSIPTPIVFVR